MTTGVQASSAPNNVEITKTYTKKSTSPLKKYCRAFRDTWHLIFYFKRDTCFHDLLEERFQNLSKGEARVITLYLFKPSWQGVVQKVLAIGEPPILDKLRKIPRSETNQLHFEKHPEDPRISGGRLFNSILGAIGMQILSAPQEVHQPFNLEMLHALSLPVIDDKFANNPLKKRFVQAVKEEVEFFREQIEHSIRNDNAIEIDFKFSALKIFLSSYYPEGTFTNEWLNNLSEIIDHLTKKAYEAAMNPYANIDKLREEAQEQLNPFIDYLMQFDQTSYLREEYVAETSKEILREIIISLIFAGSDNINKFLMHAFVEFGNDTIRSNFLNKKIDDETLKKYLAEIARLYPVIYAQNGTVVDASKIQYGEREWHLEPGDEIHYTTWQANRNKAVWGESADEFNPDGHGTKNSFRTFGSGERLCRGKAITLAIVQYIVKSILDDYRWESFVDGKKNYHPKEYKFNNTIPGVVKYKFEKVN